MEGEKNLDNNSFASSYKNVAGRDQSTETSEKASLFYIGSSSLSTIGNNYVFQRGVKIKRAPGPLYENNLKGVAEFIGSGKAKNIIVLSGAGISTNSSIPDFRSQNSGFNSIFEKYNIETPESFFALNTFRANPQPFYSLCKSYLNVMELARPTFTHYFIKSLADRNVLLRNYTQNVDGLELATGVDQKYVIASHGTLKTASCIECHAVFEIELFKEAVIRDEILYCNCGGLVKPDVIFYGERLPEYFFNTVETDCMKCDMVIVTGTSLYVYPISHLTQLVSVDVPRVLINREKVGFFKVEDDIASNYVSECSSGYDRRDTDSIRTLDDVYTDRLSSTGDTLDDSQDIMELISYDRDVVWLGDTDDGFRELARYLGWEKEIEAMMNNKKTM